MHRAIQFYLRAILPSDQWISFLSYALSVRIAADSERWIVTLLVYFYKGSGCNNIFLDLFLKQSIFVGNFALFYVVVLFFFYLNSFGQENVNTQRDANVTESVVMPPELWRSDAV